MALSSDLKVYKDTYEMASFIMDCVDNFPKAYKHNLGNRLIDKSLNCLDFIERANTDRDHRASHLSNFQIEFAALKTLLNLCKDRHLINLRQSGRFGAFSSNIGRQIVGWKKSALRES